MIHMEESNQQQKQQRQQYSMRPIINFLQGVAFTIFVFTILLVIYLIITYFTRLEPHNNYGIVFDAGSSHTEMFVYYWPADKSDGLGTTSTVNEYFVCPLMAVNITDPIKQGEFIKLKAISDFEQHLDSLVDYFQPCLTKAILKIPSNRHKVSPIFLGATAGMRLTLLRNATRAKQVLETIREIFSNTPFQFVVARQVRILTGMEEAVDGWITTNLLLEKFKHRHARRSQLEGPKSEDEFDPYMVGVLDLGGASTQVTFTYKDNVNNESIPDEFTTSISLFDTVYNPYAHSYLCWGKHEALKRYRARLLNAALSTKRLYLSNTKQILVRDPCLTVGANDTLTMNSLFRSSCTANEKQVYHTRTNITTFKFIGTGNASQCRQNIINLFDAKRNDKTVNCSYKQEYCTFDHTFQPDLPDNIYFIGLSGYYYVFNNLAFGMPKPEGLTTERYRLRDFPPEVLTPRLFNVCETHYQTLRLQENITPDNEQHKRGLCFDAWYMWLLLTHAIGFKKNNLERLNFANTFPTGKVGWTLGYMINQTNYIPAEYREKKLSKTDFIGWLSASLIITLITLIFLLLTCYICCQKKFNIITRSKDGYNKPNENANI
ncbi:unnamed protein product [Rotaria sordida]|uniref:Uncharacterized protein n=1 Tax=Rotaria sordida TaxID=392033 RepID=A0A819HEG8_9BILA|nr:unnamed protein product [Rotaria sordida]CAF3896868.1 unnamed protein product [Rotaria sordida]